MQTQQDLSATILATAWQTPRLNTLALSATLGGGFNTHESDTGGGFTSC